MNAMVDPIQYEIWSKKCNNGQYIGESSRPLRERVSEHMDNLRGWRSDSFQIHHWMSEHATDTSPPEFTFRVLNSCNDALRRQLGEGIQILETGSLNNI